MAKLIMCKGLPASGKSTWADDQILKHNDWSKQPYTVVNKDLIRLVLGKPWSHQVEKEVIQIRDKKIKEAFNRGCEVVISDDTNLAPKHEARLRQIAKECGVDFEINDSFLQVSLEECLRRNAGRSGAARLDGRVIIDMHTKYITPALKVEAPEVKPYVPNPKLPSAIICDLDGTLAIHDGRGPFDFAKCDTDKVNPAVDIILHGIKAQGIEVIFMSGRDDSCRQKTAEWIKEKAYIFPRHLHMRVTGDKRKDCIVKAELFDAHVRDSFNVLFCLDDRDQVVKLWRSMGLTCLQVAEGSF